MSLQRLDDGRFDVLAEPVGMTAEELSKDPQRQRTYLSLLIHSHKYKQLHILSSDSLARPRKLTFRRKHLLFIFFRNLRHTTSDSP